MNSPFQPITDNEKFVGAPQQAPFAPQINCRQHMQPFVVAVAANLIAYMQIDPNASVLRQALFRRMVNRGYNNQDFIEMVSECTDYIDALVSSDQSKNINNTLAVACEQTVAFWMAMEAHKDTRLQGYLTPQQAQDVNYLCEEYNRTGASIRSFIDGQQQQQRPANFGGQSAVATSWNNGGNNNGGGQFENRSRSNFTNTPAFGNNNQGVPSTLSTGIGTGRTSAPRNIQSTTPIAVPATAVLTPAPTPKGKNMQDYIQQLPSNPAVDYLGTVHPYAFNVATHVAFYKRKTPDTFINHLVALKGITMDYQLHENQYLLKPRMDLPSVTPSVSSKNKAQAELIARLTKDLNGSNIITGIVPELEFDLFRISDYVGCNGNIHDTVVTYVADNGLDVDLESMGVIATLVSFESVVYSPALANLLTEVACSTTTVKMGQRLLALQSKLPLHHWVNIDRRVTDHLNEWLYRQSPLLPVVTSFSLNIESLVASLNEDDPDILEALDTSFIDEVASQTLAVANGELYAEMMGEPENKQPRLARYETVACIPHTAADLGFAVNGLLGTVTKHSLPELHEFLNRVQPFSDPRTRWFRLLTLDNISLYVYRSPDKHTYLIGGTNNFSNPDAT